MFKFFRNVTMTCVQKMDCVSQKCLTNASKTQTFAQQSVLGDILVASPCSPLWTHLGNLRVTLKNCAKFQTNILPNAPTKVNY